MNAITCSPTQQRFRSSPVRAERDIEYDAFSRVTRGLQRGGHGQGSLAQAAAENVELWSTLAIDLADEENGLPVPLRGQLLSLAFFSIRHAQRVMYGDASPQPLIDVNLSIMKGLRGEVAA